MGEHLGVALLGLAVMILFLVAAMLRAQVVWLQRQMAVVARHLNLDVDELPPLSDRVKAVAADPGRKIEAIKLLREETGAGLAEAKAAVEAYTRTLGR
jgi:ribosomal protein L7/L12